MRSSVGTQQLFFAHQAKRNSFSLHRTILPTERNCVVADPFDLQMTRTLRVTAIAFNTALHVLASPSLDDRRLCALICSITSPPLYVNLSSAKSGFAGCCWRHLRLSKDRRNNINAGFIMAIDLARQRSYSVGVSSDNMCTCPDARSQG